MYETTETEQVEGASQCATPTDDAIGRRGFLAAAGLVGAGVAAGPVAGKAGPAAQTSEAPTVTVTPAEAAIDPGGTTTVDVGLTKAPDGLSGFDLEVTVETAVARVVDAGLGEAFADALVQDVETADGTARLAAAKSIGDGATDLDVGYVEIEGVEAGETTAEIEIVRLEDGDGTVVESSVESATLTVGDGDPADGGSETTAGSDDGIPGFGPSAAVIGAAGWIAYALGKRGDRSGRSE
ncbi:hypothetical protein [Natrinema salsiterrestre]|uniref:PGF-CTERM sorting domain-containing protein n=1 Tax=Natrinema salsiterrestre TaxID=2950540 RepID=A0A9Q4L7C0_9EURY|nr:hypothetical protein [Natrinema salsiterrestre]MDF9747290.1 hypothetical protein [Natrinema salsiterrestre]